MHQSTMKAVMAIFHRVPPDRAGRASSAPRGRRTAAPPKKIERGSDNRLYLGAVLVGSEDPAAPGGAEASAQA